MKKTTLLLLLGILVLGFALRLYKFDAPVADWHSWRQADTSAVSRNFVEQGFDLLHPKFDDLSNVASGQNNPKGYRFVEFPIYNGLQAGLFKTLGVFTLEGWGRMISIFSSLFVSVFVFLILKKHHSETAGLIGAFFAAGLPFSVYFGRTILPDMSMAAAMLGGIYFFDLWTSENLKLKTKSAKLQLKNKSLIYFVLSLILTTVALLLKPFALFFTLPMVYLAFKTFGKKAFVNPYLWVFAVMSILPLGLWRIWMMQFPEGIPANSWLFNEGNIRFKGAYFYWIFGERLGKLILGYWGISLLVLGIISKIKKDGWFLYSFIFSSLLYLVIIARGNVQHDYYQVLIIPTLAIFLGLGGEFLLNFVKTYTNKYVGPAVFIVITFFTLSLSWYYVRDLYNINNPSIITAGEAADRLLPKDAKVIAIQGGDTSFLYQTKRRGWASFAYDIEELVGLGADYLIFANPTPSDLTFSKKYEVFDQAPEYIIYDLNKPL